MREKIDVVILTKNEEDVIKDAIESVKGWAENIILIDSGSTDKTLEIAEKLGAIVISHEFKDFSHQRNFALSKVKSPWVFYMDSDERITDEFKEEVSQKLEVKKDASGFIIKRKTYYFGHDWGFFDKMPRVFKVSAFNKWTGVVHETPHVNGNLVEIENPILHFTHRNLSQMISKTNNWSDYEANLRYKNHHPKMQAWRFIRVMVSEFIRSYIKEKGYRNGTYGLIESIYQSYSIFITYAKLWELQKKN